jgi:flavin-dependent dehydrogenase
VASAQAPWCPFSDKEKIIYRGLAERVFVEARKGVAHIPSWQLDWVPIDQERLKRVYDDLVTSAGATVLFHTLLSGVETDGNGGVTTLLISNKRGLSALRAKVYVDTTGDGDVAAWAGAEFQEGDPETGDLQPATHCFVLANADD